MIERSALINKLSFYKDTAGLVKVLMGVRRCGKSTLLDQT
jgi:predicted AAA+ superfamily ATPase